MTGPLVAISARILTGLKAAVARAGVDVALAWELDEADKARVRCLLHAGEAHLTPEVL